MFFNIQPKILRYLGNSLRLSVIYFYYNVGLAIFQGLNQPYTIKPS